MRIDGKKALQFIHHVVTHFIADQCPEHAAALTYTTLFAVVPVMTVTFTLLSAVPSLNHVGQNVQSFVFDNFVPASGEVVQRYLQDFAQQAAHLTLVGLLMLFVTAIMMLVSIEKAFNHVWRVHRARPGLAGFLRYWAVLSLGPVLLGAGFALTSYVASLQLFASAESVMTHVVPGLSVMPLLFSIAAFVLLYVTVPNCHVPIKAGIIGGSVAAILFESAKQAFTSFVSHFPSYKFIYGAFAAVPLFLLWIYLSWMIILFGVEVTRAVATWHALYTAKRHPTVALMQLLQRLHDLHLEGREMPEIEGMELLQTAHQDEWMAFIDRLVALNLVARTESGGYVLCRDLASVNVYGLWRALPWPMPDGGELSQLAQQELWAQRLLLPVERVQSNTEQMLSLPLAALFRRGEEELTHEAT